MTIQATGTLILLLILFVMLIKTKIPAAALFSGALIIAITAKLAPTELLLKGFSNQGMLTVGVLFIVAAGMYSTGAISQIIDKIMGLPKSILNTQLKILPSIAVGSAFLNNTPLIAMMIPVIRDISRTANLSVRQIYLPMSYSSIMGGTCTMIGTSTNLVIAGLVADTLSNSTSSLGIQLRNIRMFDSAWPGVPVTLAGILFMILFVRFFLPRRSEKKNHNQSSKYYSTEFRVKKKSHLIGKTLLEAGFTNTDGLHLMRFFRHGSPIDTPANLTLKPGDHLVFTSSRDTLTRLWRHNNLVPKHIGDVQKKRHRHLLVTAVISATSPLSGRRVKHLPGSDSPYTFRIVALSRDGDCLDIPLEDIEIQSNDNVVLEVDETFLYHSQVEKDFSLTKILRGCYLHRTHRSLVATLITAAMILSVAFGWMSMLNAAMLASLAMIVTGCLTLRVAARSIDWKTLLVIACALGLGAAVTESGLADMTAGVLIWMGKGNAYTLLGAVFIGTTLMTNIITNNAAAAFMFPIVISTARQMDLSAMPFVITLMVSASCAFITPTGYQTNLMIWQPGEYAFTDFIKLGTPLTVIVGVLTIFLVPLVYSF